jgi:limonene-1,2-epoxide hydrolase
MMDYNNERLGAICGCDDIINLCNRTTSGNIAHNIAAIRNAAQEIKKYLLKLDE